MSAVANLTWLRGMLRCHLVLVYTIHSKKTWYLTHKRLIFRHFGGVFRNLGKICQAISNYYVPILKSDPNFGAAYVITFIRRTYCFREKHKKPFCAVISDVIMTPSTSPDRATPKLGVPML